MKKFQTIVEKKRYPTATKEITFADDMVKIKLLYIVKQQKIIDIYAINEVAKEKNY